MSSAAELDRLLQLRNEHPEQVAAIDAQIRQTFLQTHAVLVLDMAGFSRLTIRYSIIHFLAMVHRMQAIAVPIVERQKGTVVKREADNLYAVFPQVSAAIGAATDILKALAAVNTGLPDAQDLYASIGIGYGELLMIEAKEMYGNEMNLACKLGEDLARPGEILLTEAAYAQIEDSKQPGETLAFSIAGLELTTYRLLV